MNEGTFKRSSHAGFEIETWYSREDAQYMARVHLREGYGLAFPPGGITAAGPSRRLAVITVVDSVRQRIVSLWRASQELDVLVGRFSSEEEVEGRTI